MARKPCAQDLPTFPLDSKNCGCHEKSGRFSRIARNAILPFYIDYSQKNIITNEYKKVFYIKNPKFFSGTAVNNPGSRVTQAMRFSHLARNTARTVDGRRTTLIVNPTSECTQHAKNIVWYGGYLEEINQNINVRNNCKCSRDSGVVLRNN